MQKRFIYIWFHHLITNWFVIRRPELKDTAFVFAGPELRRMVIRAASAAADAHGIRPGIPLADAKAIVPDLQVFDDKPGRDVKLLTAIAEWGIRYAPLVATAPPDGIIMDISGCAHLWGGEQAYLDEIRSRLQALGYVVSAAIADTIGTANAIARYGKSEFIVPAGGQAAALLPLPPAALALEPAILQRMFKLGLHQINSFIHMPRTVLRRRFGEELLLKLSQALGQSPEMMRPLHITPPYQERLPCLEPVRTRSGIELAIKMLLDKLCSRLQGEGKGLRSALLKCYRVDGRIIQVEIGTSTASAHISHLFKLFELKIQTIAPGLGIELFSMDAAKTEDVSPLQEAIWSDNPGTDDRRVAELMDRLAMKVGAAAIHRYLPEAHHWPERTVRNALSIHEQPSISWGNSRPRPTQLLAQPEPVAVSAPIPDYPPMLFIYKGKRHQVKKADGPERIEREWWLDKGEHRDYYYVEDQDGQRYWLFRSGHYSASHSQWFIHGFFA